jgi:arylsulfatase A-like enzyme
MIAQYDGEIRQHDDAMGRLLEFLERSALMERTVVLITAVHGEEFYEHGGWGHGHSLHDELIHVPMIWRVPGMNVPPQRIGRLVSLIDIYPTLCTLCGLEEADRAGPAAAGRDLTPLFSGEPWENPRDYVYAEIHQGGHWARALRTESRKAIQVHYGRLEARLLYDLAADPMEGAPLPEESTRWGRSFFQRMEELSRGRRPNPLR